MGFQKSVPSLRAQISATIAQHPTKRRTGRRTMRAIGLVLLSIAIMALLLTDADAKRRSSAQGSQAAGASRSWCAVHPRHGSENCGYICRSINAGRRSGRKAAGAAPIHFRARHTGPATPGQVRSAKAAAGLTDRRTRASRRTYVMKTLVAVAILAMVIVPPALAKAKRAQSARPQQGYQSSERPGYYHGYPLSDWYRDSLSSY